MPRPTSLRLVALCCTLAAIAAFSCRSAPMTGRKQLLMVPESQEVALGLQSYQEILGSEPVSTNRAATEMVQRVGRRIAAVADRDDYEWEFQLIASPQQNAFCLPGGKVAIYEGILPICQNEAGLAVVMSHEIGHALARHGGERMSHSYAVNAGSRMLSYVLQSQDEQRRKMVEQAYGLGTEYGFVLPYSRKHESEADHMGILLMARAGYDPQEAPRFWERFSASGGEKPPEFLSTHPADARRAADLRALLPEAGGLYASATPRYGLGEIVPVAALAAGGGTAAQPAAVQPATAAAAPREGGAVRQAAP